MYGENAVFGIPEQETSEYLHVACHTFERESYVKWKTFAKTLSLQ